MKITELKCTSCNATLKLDANAPYMATCEYCQATYIIHQDENKNVYLSLKQESSMENQKSERWYVPSNNANIERTRKAWEYVNWKRGIICTIVVLIMIVASRWEALLSQFEKRDEPAKVEVMEVEHVLTEDKVSESEVLTGVLAELATMVLQKPANEIHSEDLACFTSIEMKYTKGSIEIGYSFQGEGTNQEPIEWVYFPRDGAQLGFKMLSKFKGLKKLEVAGYLSAQDVEGLQLESLTCYAKSPQEIAQIMDTTHLKVLNISGGLESLVGINQFENLEKLTLYCYEIKDIKELIHQKQLKSLTIENGDEIGDFTVLALMTGLEELSIESENLRDLHFLDNLTQLQSFSISDAPVLQVNSLSQLKQLKTLSIQDCDELKDLSVLEGLTTLNTLVLEVPYHCPSPDLSELTSLNKLSISGMKDIQFLRYMTALEELRLDRCDITEPEIFTHLTTLKTLQCMSIGNDLSNWKFLTKIPALENLNLTGISTYEDLSSLFNIPSLKQLVLNGVEGEVNFSNVKQNPTLEVLEMDGIKLYKNAQVRGENGFYAVSYDGVSLDENIEFIKCFPNLIELSLADNTLTHLEFAKELHRLKRLDISGNYITDLKALEGLVSLKQVDCTQNPIENYRVLSDQVTVIY